MATPNTIDPYKLFPENKSDRFSASSSLNFTPGFVTSALKTPNTELIYASRIRGRQIMLENPIRESKLKQQKAQKAQRRREKQAKKATGLVGQREAIEKDIWSLQKDQARFGLFLPLHRLWLGYMSELLALPVPPASETVTPYVPNAASMHAKLVKADYHGSLITVAEAKNTALVGICGIVVHETENAFRIVTKQDQTKLVPKQNSIFTFGVPLYSVLSPTHTPESISPSTGAFTDTRTVVEIPHLLFTLYGNQLCFRASERAGKKFKAKETIEL